MHHEFVVRVIHEGRPLQGVSVQVTSTVGTVTRVQFSGVTASDGTVHVTGLSVGNYWLRADLLGINAAYECFHVAQRTSVKARHSLTYEWGDSAPSTRRIAGALIDSQAGKGGTPLWNLTHRVDMPITGTKLTLRNPVTGDVFDAASDQEGTFAFDHIPNGTYVLHAEGGRSNRDYASADKLVKLSPEAIGNSLVLTRRDASGGSCGGTSLEISGTRY